MKEHVIIRGETFHLSSHKFLLPSTDLGAKRTPVQGSVAEEKLLFSILPASRTGKFRDDLEMTGEEGIGAGSPSGWCTTVDALSQRSHSHLNWT